MYAYMRMCVHCVKSRYSQTITSINRFNGNLILLTNANYNNYKLSFSRKTFSTVISLSIIILKHILSSLLCVVFVSEGKIEESLKFLVRYVEVAERSGQDMALAKACQNLGYIYNSRVSKVAFCFMIFQTVLAL